MKPGLHVTDTPQHCAAMQVEHELAIGVVEASNLGEGLWSVDRAFVRPSHRGKGLGTKLLKQLQETLSKRPDCQRLIVTPGGYGEKIEDQIHFYEKSGFTRIEDEEGECWIWRPKTPSTESSG